MNCNPCNCNPCSGPVDERHLVAPQVQVRSFNEANGCPIKGWYETLGVPSWTPPAAGATTALAVCDATQYPVGTCVLVSDGTNKRVLKVVGWNNDKDVIYILGYNNAETFGGTMSGVINSFPLAICPVETQTGGVVCNRDWMKTSEAFVVPTAQTSGGGTVNIVFDKPQTLQNGMSIYVVGAGYMTITVPPDGPFVECGTSFYAFNSGSAGNTAAGTTIMAGAAAYPQVNVRDILAEAGVTNTTIGYGNSGSTVAFSAPFVDSALEVTVDVEINDLVEISGAAKIWSPRCFYRPKLISGPASWVAGITGSIYDGDGQTNTPVYTPHVQLLFKASAAGTLVFRWEFGNMGSGCTGTLVERSLIAKVIGNVP